MYSDTPSMCQIFVMIFHLSFSSSLTEHSELFEFFHANSYFSTSALSAQWLLRWVAVTLLAGLMSVYNFVSVLSFTILSTVTAFSNNIILHSSSNVLCFPFLNFLSIFYFIELNVSKTFYLCLM